MTSVTYLPPSQLLRWLQCSRDIELIYTLVDATAGSARFKSAVVLSFPAKRNTRLVAELAHAFIALRQRHGCRCRSILLEERFVPMANRLRRLGVLEAEIKQQLADLEAAVAGLVWRYDGCPPFEVVGERGGA